MNTTINIQKGNAYGSDLIFTDKRAAVSAPYNLTGKTISFTVKKLNDKNDNDNAAIIKKDWSIHSNAAAGESRLELTKADTLLPVGTYKYDFKIDGVNTQAGDFIVTAVITTR